MLETNKNKGMHEVSVRVFPMRSTMVSYVVNGVPRQFAVM